MGNVRIIKPDNSNFIGSALQRIENDFNSLVLNTYKITKEKSANTSVFNECAKKITKDASKFGDANSGLLIADNRSTAINTEPMPLTVSILCNLWNNNTFSLKSRWHTPVEFIKEYALAFKEYSESTKKSRKEKDKVATDATRLIYETGVERSINWAFLGTSFESRSVNDADREFLYNHLRQNCGAVYWVNESGFSTPLPRDDKTGALRMDFGFWDVWEKDCADILGSYLNIIIDCAETLRNDYPIASTGLPAESVDSIIGERVPRIILRNIAIGVESHKETDAKGKNPHSVFDRFRLSISTKTGSTRSISLEDWEKVLSLEMARSLSMENVKPIKQFSNIPGESLCYINLDGVDTLGTKGKILAQTDYAEPPALPEGWRRFLCGANGEKYIFESDVIMSLLRLAYFVVQCVWEKSTRCRQILCLAGSGNDGKSVLCDLLQRIIGLENSVALKPDKLDEDAGTYPALNKALICLPECKSPSNIFRTPFVKSITGGDTIALRALFCMPIQWTPEHSRVLMTTNNTVYVNNENEISRLLPLALHKNYTNTEQLDISWFREHCIDKERKEFIQWAFNTVAFYKNFLNSNGERLPIFKSNGLAIISDETFNKWVAGELELNDSTNWDAITKEAIENCGNNRYHVSLSEDADESDEELYKTIFNLLFELSENGKLQRVDIAERLQAASCSKDKTANLVRLASLFGEGFTRKAPYKSFIKYIRSQQGVTETTIHGVRYFKGVRFKGETEEKETIEEGYTAFIM